MFKDTERIMYKDALETSKEEVKYLKETKNCSVVIPMTHQFSAEDCALSKALGDDVDVILGAHDHSTEFTSVCGHAPYLKAASNLKTQWVITLWLNDDGHVESVDGRLLSLTDADPFDNDIHAKVVEWEEKGSVEMGKKCGCSKTDIDAIDAHSRQQLTTGGIFFTDAVRAFHKTDVAMINGGTIRGDKVYQAGDLTKATLTQMHPFGNAIVKVYATGKQLNDYINEMLNCWENVCGNFVQVSGLKYTFKSDAPVGKRLVSLTLPDDTPINATKKYTVALSDYMLANSKMNKNKLYNMVTTNDAVPIVMALFDAAEKAGDDCIDVTLDGRIKQV